MVVNVEAFVNKLVTDWVDWLKNVEVISVSLSVDALVVNTDMFVDALKSITDVLVVNEVLLTLIVLLSLTVPVVSVGWI